MKITNSMFYNIRAFDELLRKILNVTRLRFAGKHFVPLLRSNISKKIFISRFLILISPINIGKFYNSGI